MKKNAIVFSLFMCLTHTAGLGYATFGLDTLRLCVSARENDALGNRLIMPVCCSDEGIVITDHSDPLKRPLMEADDDDGIILPVSAKENTQPIVLKGKKTSGANDSAVQEGEKIDVTPSHLQVRRLL